MTFDEYQKKALKTAYTDPAYTDTLMDKTIWVLGISGEAGEVVERWKKIVAYQAGNISKEDLTSLETELGDIMWYVATFAHSLGLSLDDIAKINLRKLADRQKRHVIKGKGDNR
jgi:NTP pyrophosphatase (non-canonical NTP hydrolase)